MIKVNKVLDALFPNFTCLACGCEIQNSANAYLCEECISGLPFNLDINKKHIAPFSYEEPIRSIILKLKYGDNGFAARAVAPYMAAIFLKRFPKKRCTLIPVPLCKSRQRERGYNQSELLANEIASYLDFHVANDVLIRVKKTKPQKNMIPAQRAENMKNAFAINENNTAQIKNKNILLIDDVYTTGATTGECSKVLRKHGAKTVTILTIASAS
jgi:ComF family protein